MTNSIIKSCITGGLVGTLILASVGGLTAVLHHIAYKLAMPGTTSTSDTSTFAFLVGGGVIGLVIGTILGYLLGFFKKDISGILVGVFVGSITSGIGFAFLNQHGFLFGPTKTTILDFPQLLRGASFGIVIGSMVGLIIGIITEYTLRNLIPDK